MTVTKETWRVARVAREHDATIQEITDAINEGRADTISQSLVLREVTKPAAADQPTLEEFAAQRAEEDRPIAVWVEGDPSARVSGRATAKHVATLLTDDESEVVEPQQYDVAATRGDTLLFTFESGIKGINQIRNRAELRVQGNSVVIHSAEMPAGITYLLDAHVKTGGIDEPVEVTRYEHNAFEDTTYEIQLAGLTEGDDAE